MESSSPCLPPHYRLSLQVQGGVLTLGPAAAMPSPTPSSNGTISAAAADLSPSSIFVHGSSLATGSRGWAGDKPAAPLNAQSTHSLSIVSVDSVSSHAVVAHQQPSAPPLQLIVPQCPCHEYTCRECVMSFPTNQALGGHAAGHRNRQREAEAMALAAGMGPQDGNAFLDAPRRARTEAALHECRKCHKVFTTGVALGGHMRVHYTGAPIVPKRKNTKRAALALLPVEHGNVAATSSPWLSLALSINTYEAHAAGAAGRVVRLFGVDISPQVQAPSEEQSSGTTED